MSSDETLPDSETSLTESFFPIKEGYIRKLPPLSKNPSHKVKKERAIARVNRHFVCLRIFA